MVSRNRTGTLEARHYTLDTGAEAELLDVIEVQVASARPQVHQPENWLVGREGWAVIDWVFGPPRWKFVAKLEKQETVSLLSGASVKGPAILGNSSDRVPHDTFKTTTAAASLTLVEPSNLSFVVNESYRGSRIERRILAKFRLGEQQYNLSVTDPRLEQRLSTLPYGEYDREAAGLNPDQRLFLTVSLGEPFQGVCFKLVAGVIALPP